MVAETVERSAARYVAGQPAILPLIEKRSGFLPGPRRREITHGVFIDLDLLGHFAVQQDGFPWEPFATAKRNIVPRQYAVGSRDVDDCVEDLAAECLEASAHELYDGPAIVLVADK
jgi:hypothetical protein